MCVGLMQRISKSFQIIHGDIIMVNYEVGGVDSLSNIAIRLMDEAKDPSAL